jgi:hypothetical protein
MYWSSLTEYICLLYFGRAKKSIIILQATQAQDIQKTPLDLRLFCNYLLKLSNKISSVLQYLLV